MRVIKNTGTGWLLSVEVMERVWQVVSQEGVGYSEGQHILLKHSNGRNTRATKSEEKSPQNYIKLKEQHNS